MINSANLAVVLWLRNLQEFDAIEAKIARAFPSAQIEDRWMLPRFAKRIGHILTPAGLHAEFVMPNRAPLPLRLSN